MTKEPAALIGIITAIVAAVLVLLREFGVDITDGQQEAIRNVVAVLAPVIVGLVVRQYVVSPATAGEAVAIAKGNSPTSANVPAVNVPGYEGQVAGFLRVPKSTLEFAPEADGHRGA